MKRQINIDRIQRGITETYKTWLSWFTWFFGINFLCLGWIWATTVTKSFYFIFIAISLIFYHLTGIIISIGLAYYCISVYRFLKKNNVKMTSEEFGFPLLLASLSIMFSVLNLILQTIIWILIIVLVYL